MNFSYIEEQIVDKTRRDMLFCLSVCLCVNYFMRCNKTLLIVGFLWVGNIEHCRMGIKYTRIHKQNNSLNIMLTATDQKLQISF